MIEASAFVGEFVRTVIVMTLSASTLALLLLLIKPFTRHRLPKTVQYYLWLVVLVALLVPVSKFVVMPETSVPIITAPIHTFVENNVISIEEESNRPTPVADVTHTAAADTTADNVAVTDNVAGNAPETAATDATSFDKVLPPLEASLLTKVRTGFMLIYPWVALFIVIYHIAGYLYFKRKIRRSRISAQESDIAALNELTGRRSPQIYRSSWAATPMLIGVFKSVIILPDRAYTDTQLSSVLQHELTHLRRHDAVVKWLSVFACALHWFNPVVWLIRREICRGCELSCDEAVIRKMNVEDKKNYGKTLIAMTANTKVPQTVLTTMMSEEKKDLKERLTSIMKNKQHKRMTLVISALIFIAMCCAACALGAANSNKSADPQEIIVNLSNQGITNEKLAEMIESGEIPKNVTKLDLSSNRINDLTPLQTLTSLTELNLIGKGTRYELLEGEIRDITPLQALTDLTVLYLDNNAISDITPLESLTNLKDLSLSFNTVSNLTPLAALTGLEKLTLDSQSNDLEPNEMEPGDPDYRAMIPEQDITPLKSLLELKELSVRHTSIKDLTPLGMLTGLTKLDLFFDQSKEPQDIGPLGSLTNLRELRLEGVSDITPLSSLTELKALTLIGDQIKDITSLQSLTGLTDLYLEYLPISDITPLQSLTGLTSLTLKLSQISDLTPLQTLTGLTYLCMDGLPSISDATPLQTLTGLTELSMEYIPISDIAFLQSLTDLTDLTLAGVSVSDITPLQSLTGLTKLSLSEDPIKDITPLASLTKLTELRLWRTEISDITPLQSLTGLTTLDLSGYNKISDISPLQSLTGLQHLFLSGYYITDMTPLSSLTGLMSLDLSGHYGLSDISPLEKLTGLTSLNLANTGISDIAPLKFLTDLKTLDLNNYNNNSRISDIKPLGELTGLTELGLTGTKIADINALKSLENLKILTISDITELSTDQINDLRAALPKCLILAEQNSF